MTPNATGSSSCGKARLALVAAGSALLAACAVGPQAGVAGTNPAMSDAGFAPVADLNLRRDPIPPILLQARESPYARYNTGSCAAIAQELGLLNAALGEDYDTADAAERKLSAEQVAAFLIPFRGAIREVSGANRHEWEFRRAISAGLMRRAYLKGRGEAIGCPYPARPYPARMVSDPTNFEDLGEPPPEMPADPRRMVNLGG